MPTTQYSIIWKERWKLYTNAGRLGWYPPRRGPSSKAIPADNVSWPCRGPGPDPSFLYPAGCAICTPEHPCLFDLKVSTEPFDFVAESSLVSDFRAWLLIAQADPSERTNLAGEQPAIVAQLAKEMARYAPYVDGQMTAEELAKYECLPKKPWHWPQPYPLSPWFGNYTSPCCRPKPGAAPAA